MDCIKFTHSRASDISHLDYNYSAINKTGTSLKLLFFLQGMISR